MSHRPLESKSTVLEGSSVDPVNPPLRWVGGKRLIVPYLLERAPSDLSKRVYHEPFVGAGSFFFALGPTRARLSDANAHLIACYRRVRDEPESIARYLEQHRKLHSSAHYYRERETYNRSRPSAAQAARFIYLNQSCFNGVFRVNMEGKYNVPYGKKDSPNLPNASHLKRISTLLHSATLMVADYQKAIAHVRKGDFVYLDPPYPPLNGTAYFTHYTKERFGDDDQSRLAKAVRELDRRGAMIMMSNADLPGIRRLYRGFTIRELSVMRFVSCKKTKHAVGELVVTNY